MVVSVADKLPGSITTAWSLTESRTLVVLGLFYFNQFRLEISVEQKLSFSLCETQGCAWNFA